jgi:hypothetical protein
MGRDKWEGAPTKPEDWPDVVPLYKLAGGGRVGRVAPDWRSLVVSVTDLDKVEQRFYVPAVEEDES